MWSTNIRRRHRLWSVTDQAKIAEIQQAMAPKKLLIADGHHRYETALGYRNDHPDDPAAQYVMMTFVNMYSPGLKILATHRVLRNVANFGVTLLAKAAAAGWKGSMLASLDEVKRQLSVPKPEPFELASSRAITTWCSSGTARMAKWM